MVWFLMLLVSGLPAEDEPVARVNGEPVTFAELMQELVRSHGSQALEKLISQKIIEAEMRRTGVQVSEKELDRELERERESVARDYGPGASLEKLVSGKLNMAVEEYKERVLKLRVFAMKVLRPTVEEIPEGELARYFAQREERYSVPERRRVSHILIFSVDPRTNRPRSEEEISRLVERVRSKLDAGGDFSELARRFSEDESTRRKGGDFGWMDSLAEGAIWGRALRDAAFMLPEGQPGGPVPSPYGRHFLLVTQIIPGKRRPYDAVRDKVREDYAKEQLRIRSDRWVKDLLSGAKVEVLYEFTPRPER